VCVCVCVCVCVWAYCNVVVWLMIAVNVDCFVGLIVMTM